VPNKTASAVPSSSCASEPGIGSSYDVLAIWSAEADDVRGRALDCGHFLAEERPDEVAFELTTFLARI
jgi:hypothetical protein